MGPGSLRDFGGDRRRHLHRHRINRGKHHRAGDLGLVSIAAIACGLAALCYAEFASTLPVAGSAYTFSYATFGEFLAWTIGWNLVLELAVGAAVVAKGWSSYLGTVFGLSSATVNLAAIKLDWGSLLIVALVARCWRWARSCRRISPRWSPRSRWRWWCW